MRIFVAIELPEAKKEVLSALVERLRKSNAKVAWAKPEAMHLTLRFLGELDDAHVSRMGQLLGEGYEGTRVFTLHVGGLGAFPNTRRPSVVWAGVTPREGALAAAQAVSENAARAIGLLPEKKEFHPHLTLARIKDPAQGAVLASVMPAEEAFDAGDFEVTGVTLFSSRATPKGHVHEPVQRYGFE